MNIAKRAKAIVEHDRAELAHEAAQTALASIAALDHNAPLGVYFARWREAHNWLGWTREGLRRHGAKEE